MQVTEPGTGLLRTGRAIAAALGVALAGGCDSGGAGVPVRPAMGEPAAGQLTVYDGVPGIQRHGLGPAFFAGPGDPEDFLFRDDIELILDKLEQTGSRTLYVQMVRSHGGDGTATHNPFVGHDPNQGVDVAVLDRWHAVFKRLEAIDVDVFLFLYDDSSSPWRDPDDISAAEADFIDTVVNRFKGLRNIVWVVAEEYAERLGSDKVEAIAARIFELDEHRHPIGVHKNAGTSFEEFSGSQHLSVFLAQLPELPPDELYRVAREMRATSGGRYLPIMSEMANWSSGELARKRAWASAMAATPVLAYTYDVANTAPADLRALGELQRLFEDTGAHTFRPSDTHSLGGRQWVLADPTHGRYLVYTPDVTGEADRRVGVDIPYPGLFELLWLDIPTGARITETKWGDGRFTAPATVTGEAALYVQRQNLPSSIYPGERWDTIPFDAAGVDREAVQNMAAAVEGDGCVVRYGRMVYCWGEPGDRSDWASISKPVINSMILMAQADGSMGSLHQPVAAVGWDLTGKDRHLTWHQLLNMTSGYGRAEPPGGAWAYNDHGVRLYALSFERVLNKSLNELVEQYLAPLQFEQPPLFGRRKGLGLDASVPDVARLALWWRNLGEWSGRALVPRTAMTAFMSPVVPSSLPVTREDGETYLDLGTFGGSTNQTPHGPGHFGNGWWFNTPTPFSDVGPAWPDLPEDTIMSTGHWGKELAAIFPSLDLIVVWRSSQRWTAENYDLGLAGSRINTILGAFVATVAPAEGEAAAR